MTAEGWEKVEAVFEEAIALPPEQRAALVAQRCVADPSLHAEVTSLLASFEEATGFFDRLAAQTVQPLLDGPAALAPGTRIGAYRIVEKIGQGGMGTVYLAERGDGAFEQQVAVKLLHRTADPESVRRFRAERQILASLSHPGIAHLLDGGMTEAGTPYLVMEYVDGQPITQYCDTHRYSISERLRLFEKVCEAVSYAHGHLVIHRDLKPSNILVNEAGEVKLLDFGIARLLEEHEAVAVTQVEQRLMTPQYAAPEQIRGDRVTTSADVYALGVLLFELLTGHRPYTLDGKNRHEAERAILETDPPRPSAVVLRPASRVQPGGTRWEIPPEEIAAFCGLSPQRLARRLSGELDTIVLMALRKAPERRYPSAESLGEDIRRHLAQLPVRAQGDALLYRAHRFLLRHRAGFVAATVAVLALLMGFGVALWQAGVAREERDRARLEASRAEEVAAFVGGLFLSSDPEAAGDSRLTLREVLDRSAQRVEVELRAQPEIQVSLMALIGHAYTGLGLYGQAEPLLRKAAAQAQRTPGLSVQARVEAESSLAYLLMRQGHYHEAEPLYRNAIVALEADPETPAKARAIAHNNLGLLLTEAGRLEEAEQIYRLAYHLAPDDATVLHNLASLLEEQGRFDEAVPMHRQALARVMQQYGEDNTHAASAMNALAYTLHRQGDHAEADTLYRHSLALRRRLLPPGHPHIASSLIRYGWLKIEQGKPVEAEGMLREGEAILARVIPPDHWQNASAQSLIGLALARQGRIEEGLPLLTWSYELYARTLGHANWRTQLTAQIIEGLYTQIGDSAAAAAYARPVEVRRGE